VTTCAPYNFVPFSDKVLVRYERLEDLPRHDRWDPALKTGEIHITLTAQTPVFVSNGDEDAPHFFRGANGQFLLPGSTIRGLVRETVQILGFGLVRPQQDLDDGQIIYRDMSSKKDSIREPAKQYYLAALDVETKKNTDGKTFSNPRNVQAGYLQKEDGRYVIRPVKGTYYRVARSHPGVQALGDTTARAIPVAYTASADAIKDLRASANAAPGMEHGVLLCTGRPVGEKKNHLYVFPAEDADALPVPVPDEDRLAYEVDLEGRRKALEGGRYDPDFWALPEDGEKKPVFYLRHDGHLFFGMSRFLRIGYAHKLEEGLPRQHQALAEQAAYTLDYPSAMLGFTAGNVAYRSRVTFGDCPAEGSPKEGAPVKTVLGQPKASFYPGYVTDGKNYNDADFQLRGYKQYWLKAAKAAPAEKENAASTLRPLPAGTVFHGVIRYKNLQEDELGLLLWALRLDEGCCHSIGMGKPYGFGRMKLTIDSLQAYDPQRLYSAETFCAGPETETELIDRYIAAYDAYACEVLHIKKPKKKPSIRSRAEIQDFFYLRGTVREADEVRYMTLKEYKNVEKALPTVAALREASQQQTQTAQQAAADPLAALRNKFKPL
jgi:CRISPR-associated protein (TIGR03986 family)